MQISTLTPTLAVQEAIENFQAIFRKSADADDDNLDAQHMILYNPNLAKIGHKASDTGFNSLINSDKKRLVSALWESFDGIHWSTNQMFVNQLVERKAGLINLVNTYNQRDFARKFNAREIGDSLQFDQWHFDVARLNPKSKTMPGLLLNHTRDTRTRTIQHYGVGFQIPSDWPMDPTKMGVYESHMQQMAESIQLTLDTQIQEVAVEGGLMFRFSARGCRQPFVSKKDLSDALEEHCHRTFCIQKDGTAYRGLEMEAWGKLRNKGHAPDSVLITAAALQYNNIVNPEQGKLPKFGRLPGDDQKKQIDYTGGSDGIIMRTQHQGLLAVASRPYPVGTDEIKDNTITNCYVSERYQLTCPELASSNNPEDYCKNDCVIGIVDGENKKIEEISLMTALEESGIFPNVQGDWIIAGRKEQIKMIMGAYEESKEERSHSRRKRLRVQSDSETDKRFAETIVGINKITGKSLLECYVKAGKLKHFLNHLHGGKVAGVGKPHPLEKHSVWDNAAISASTKGVIDGKTSGPISERKTAVDALQTFGKEAVEKLNSLWPCLDILRAIYASGIPLPFGMVLFRPYIRFQAGSATFFGSKDKSMATVLKHCEVMYSNDPDSYKTKVQVRFTAGSVVTEKKSIYTETNICATKYECGAGTRILQLFDENGAEHTQVHAFKSRPERFEVDMIPILVQPDFECDTWYSSITGKMPMKIFQGDMMEKKVEHVNMERVSQMLDLKAQIEPLRKEQTIFGHVGTIQPRAKHQFLCVSGATMKKDKAGKWVDARTGRTALGAYCSVEDFTAICGTKAHHAGTGLRGSTFNRPFWGRPE